MSTVIRHGSYLEEPSVTQLASKTQGHNDICLLLDDLPEGSELVEFTVRKGSPCLRSLSYYIFQNLNNGFTVSGRSTVFVNTKKQNLNSFNYVILCNSVEFLFVLKI